MLQDELLDYESFRKLASQEGLSRHARIDAPDDVREGYTEAIIHDIEMKLPVLREANKRIVDIGCGCDDMAVELVDRILNRHSEIWLLDSAEMLALMPEHERIHKISGEFPDDDTEFIATHQEMADAVLMYSMLHYVCVHGSIFNFVDQAMELLVPGGRMLLGDLPNRSKRRRFFSSSEGVKTHQQFTGTDEIPLVDPWEIEYGRLDDSILFAIMQRYRNGGHETYLLPQNNDLPFATRREDILIVKRS